MTVLVGCCLYGPNAEVAEEDEKELKERQLSFQLYDDGTLILWG
jgi:hypothetical protein